MGEHDFFSKLPSTILALLFYHVTTLFYMRLIHLQSDDLLNQSLKKKFLNIVFPK